MNYTATEKETLSMMQRTDFKNLSKTDVMGIFSQLKQLRPEVARDVLKQFPEFVGLVNTSMKEYRVMLEKIIDSDDESVKRVYDIAEKDLDASFRSRKEFYNYAEKSYADLSRCLDDPDLTWEERVFILDREREIFMAVDAKDTEIRKHDEEIIKMVDRKDSEKRQFNWGLVGAVSTGLAIALTVGVSILGGNVNLGLPNNNRSGET